MKHLPYICAKCFCHCGEVDRHKGRCVLYQRLAAHLHQHIHLRFCSTPLTSASACRMLHTDLSVKDVGDCVRVGKKILTAS